MNKTSLGFYAGQKKKMLLSHSDTGKVPEGLNVAWRAGPSTVIDS